MTNIVSPLSLELRRSVDGCRHLPTPVRQRSSDRVGLWSGLCRGDDSVEVGVVIRSASVAHRFGTSVGVRGVGPGVGGSDGAWGGAGITA